ncbi:cache domain-containing sensor histidine kinase [Konateibacter massiliensis]|uniref:cache domain-containing sensor histidine kinase n=1 Tax=Konateibacter massiliensis TaxID=2002841 RepID=UPI000C148FDA|nr:sensor histidine kinase [Konateibacter massiliensis]
MMKKFFFRRFKNYFLIMLLPTFLLYAVLLFFIVNKEINSISTKENHSLNSIETNINLVVDNALYQQNIMTNNPQLSISLQKMLMFHEMEYGDTIFYNSIKSILRSIADSHSYIDSIYLYLDGYDRFFNSKNGLCYLSTFNDVNWHDTYQSLDPSVNQWVNKRYVEESRYLEDVPIMTFYQRMTLLKGVIAININISDFEKMMDTLVSNSNESYYLLNGNYEILAQTEGAESISFSSLFEKNDNGLKNYWLKTEAGIFNLSSRYYEDFNITLVSSFSLKQIWDQCKPSLVLFFLTILLDLFVIFFLSYTTTKKNFQQIEHVINVFSEAENNLPSNAALPTIGDEYDVIMNNVINMFLNTTLLNSQLAEQKYREENAQLYALQLQINPHFLFNTLQTLNLEALRLSGTPTSMNTIIEQLSDILKYSIVNPNSPVSLEDEITYLKKYETIQKYRFGEQFILYYEIDEELKKYFIMRLLLQPLIENSMAHGILPTGQIGFIKLKIFRRANRICFAVIDNGAGMTKKKKEALHKRIHDLQSRSIGLSNVNQRLILKYGTECGIRVQSKKGMGTCISFSIPLGEMAEGVD